MASVEELCDNITLIDRGKTILEGRVDEIRNKWAGSEYEFVFRGDVKLHENGHFKVLSQAFENGRSTIRISTTSDTPTNEILSNVMKSGNIISFNPALPSMNEIFIRVVQSRN